EVVVERAVCAPGEPAGGQLADVPRDDAIDGARRSQSLPHELPLAATAGVSADQRIGRVPLDVGPEESVVVQDDEVDLVAVVTESLQVEAEDALDAALVGEEFRAEEQRPHAVARRLAKSMRT